MWLKRFVWIVSLGRFNKYIFFLFLEIENVLDINVGVLLILVILICKFLIFWLVLFEIVIDIIKFLIESDL